MPEDGRRPWAGGHRAWPAPHTGITSEAPVGRLAETRLQISACEEQGYTFVFCKRLHA